MRFKVTATCEGGHVSLMYYEGVTRGQAEFFASLLDGTCSIYKADPRHGPHESETIGHCGVCGKLFTCVVEEQKEHTYERH